MKRPACTRPAHLCILLATIVVSIRSGWGSSAVDCSVSPDGFYEHETGCSSNYYGCSGGVRSAHSCAAPSLSFDEDAGSCDAAENVRACQCEQTDNSHWSHSSRSCVFTDSVPRQRWAHAIASCARVAKAVGLAGRMLIADSNDAVLSIDQNSLIGMRTLEADAETYDEFSWYLAFNENAKRPLQHPFPTELQGNFMVGHDDKDCVKIEVNHPRYRDETCDDLQNIACETFYDACKNVSCAPPLVCVADTPREHTCVCPAGTTGEPDCTTNDMANFCSFIGGSYVAETDSCFSMSSTQETWPAAFASCESASAGMFVGRLAHIPSQAVLNAINTLADREDYWIALRTLTDGLSSSEYSWHLNSNNPNAAVELSFEPGTTDFNDEGKECMIRDGNEWKDKDCTDTYFYVCEYFVNSQCDTVSCAESKVCIPDTLDATHCVCPAGSLAPDCETQSMEPSCHLLGWMTDHSLSGSSCYKTKSASAESFSKALAWCHSILADSHLVFIETQSENDYIQSLISGDAFIGAMTSDVLSDSLDAYFWTADGLSETKPIDFSPSAGVTLSSDSACMTIKRGSGAWQDASCSSGLIPVCEIEIEVAAVATTTTTTTTTTSTTTTTPSTTTTTHPCIGVTCQNGAICVIVDAANYQCDCMPQYYGQHCQSYCNTSWSDWSECSKSCDHGIASRRHLVFDETASNVCSQTVHVYEYTACNSAPCRTYSRSDYADCVSRNGFFTNNACYFVVQSTHAFYWSETFDKCAAEGATVAHMYDATETVEAIMGFLMSQHPNEKVWWALKGVSGSGVSWMSDPATEVALAMFNYRVPDGMTLTEACLATVILAGETDTQGYTKLHHLPCGTDVSTPPINRALCMKKLTFADFQTSKGKRIVMQDGSTPVSMVTKDNWQCGLECSRQEMCLGYNYQPTTMECQLLNVKQRMPTRVFAGDFVHTIYMLEYNAEWNLYNRRY